MQLRDFLYSDREIYYTMSADFYRSGAALHDVNPQHLESTFDAIMASSPFVRGFIIEEAGKPAGFALLSLTWTNEAGGLCVLIEELYICPEFRGAGLGSAVLNDIFRQYPQAKRFRLEVTHTNTRARRLYESLGFEVLDYVNMVIDRPDGDC